MSRLLIIVACIAIACTSIASDDMATEEKSDKRGFSCKVPIERSKWNNKITWAFPGKPPEKVGHSAAMAALESAAKQWAALTNIVIDKVDEKSQPPPDVIVQWNHRGDRDNNPLFRESIAFSTVTDDDEFPCMPRLIVLQGTESYFDKEKKKWDYRPRSWSASEKVPKDSLDIESIVLHEWGHILFGPGHTCGFSDCGKDVPYVMESSSRPGKARRKLTEQDFAWTKGKSRGLVPGSDKP